MKSMVSCSVVIGDRKTKASLSHASRYTERTIESPDVLANDIWTSRLSCGVKVRLIKDSLHDLRILGNHRCVQYPEQITSILLIQSLRVCD